MYELLQLSKCEKFVNVIAEPKELIRIKKLNRLRMHAQARKANKTNVTRAFGKFAKDLTKGIS